MWITWCYPYKYIWVVGYWAWRRICCAEVVYDGSLMNENVCLFLIQTTSWYEKQTVWFSNLSMQVIVDSYSPSTSEGEKNVLENKYSCQLPKIINRKKTKLKLSAHTNRSTIRKDWRVENLIEKSAINCRIIEF